VTGQEVPSWYAAHLSGADCVGPGQDWDTDPLADAEAGDPPYTPPPPPRPSARTLQRRRARDLAARQGGDQ
jgi:hypothetical protein